MGLKLDDYIARVERKLQDVGQFLQADDVRNNIIQAVLVFSKDRPLVKIAELTGDGTAFDFSLPSDWNENFSTILTEVEYPVDDDTQIQPMLDRSEWAVIRKLVSGSTVLRFRFKSFIPINGNIARFEYSTRHTLNQSTNTIQDSDSQAVIAKSAAICFWALASRFAQHSDSTIDADVIDYARKYDYYKELAIAADSEYRSLMGIGNEAKNSVAASVGVSIKDYDLEFGGGALGDYLTHPSLYR
jgi:hypothetical protein